MNYQKPMMSRMTLETEAAGCPPCVILTVTIPSIRFGNDAVSGQVEGRTVTVTSPTSGGCPTAALPGTPTVGVDGAQLPSLQDIIGTPVTLPHLPPGIDSIVTLG